MNKILKQIRDFFRRLAPKSQKATSEAKTDKDFQNALEKLSKEEIRFAKEDAIVYEHVKDLNGRHTTAPRFDVAAFKYSVIDAASKKGNRSMQPPKNMNTNLKVKSAPKM